MANDDNQLGKNIQHLRELYGETLDELGEVIHFARSTVKGYENGSRKPDPHTLNKIAKHYGKTVDELLYMDLTELIATKMEVDSIKDILDLFQKILPLYSSEDAMRNSKFRNGYKFCHQIMDGFAKGETLRGTMITDAFQAFIEAFDELECPEAAANLMWTIFVWWTQIFDVKQMMSLQSEFLSNKLDIKDYLKIKENESDDLKEKKHGFVSDFDEIITEILKKLKSDSKWSDIADYYIALKYVFTMVDSELSPEMNSAVGMQMMLTFAKIGNPHALNFLKTSLST
ncbi:MAG TPA: helix-turn-helix transcriptional regulator [Ruminiclostridium sp.]